MAKATKAKGATIESSVRTDDGRALIPEGWIEASVEDIVTTKPSNGRSVTTGTVGASVLRLTALKEGRVDLTERKTGDWTLEDARPFLVKRGDFLVARGNEQGRIREAIERLESVIDTNEESVLRSLFRLTRLRQSILKSAFEGKLVPQDPSDEPASVLLARLRAAKQSAPPKPKKPPRTPTPKPPRRTKRPPTP